MLSLLAVSCYLPNATFVYNPITGMGILRATYLPESTSSAFEICQKLDGRLTRASVELANAQESFSENFEYRHQQNIQINIPFETDAEKEAGLLTTQSNFKITFLDMDAEVKQTLAYFSVLSFNANDCLVDVKASLAANVFTISAKQNGCNYSITQFGKKPSGLAPEQLNETVLAELVVFDQSLIFQVGVQFSSLTESSPIEVVFNCNNFPNVSECDQMVNNIIYNAIVDLQFNLYFQLNNPDTDYLTFTTSIDNIFDTNLVNCYSDSSYQINGELIILYFTPTNKCVFSSNLTEVIVGITNSEIAGEGVTWTYQNNQSEFRQETTTLSVECKQVEDPTCIELLSFLGKEETLLVSVTVLVYRDNGALDFIILNPRRYQSCYEYTQLTVQFESNAVEGSIQIGNAPIYIIGCTLQVQSRYLIQVSFFEKTVKNGLITDILPEPFLVLSRRDIFSVQNYSIAFEDSVDRATAQKVSSLITSKRLYCIVQYDQVIIPVIQFFDQTRIYSNTLVYSITGVSGIVAGLLILACECFCRKSGSVDTLQTKKSELRTCTSSCRARRAPWPSRMPGPSPAASAARPRRRSGTGTARAGRP